MRFTADTSLTKTIKEKQTFKKNTILQKEFNLPKKKEFVKNLYIRYEFLKNIM